MSREIEPRDIRQKGLPGKEKEKGFSIEYYKRRSRETEAANKENQNPAHKEQNDHQRDPNKQYTEINTKELPNNFSSQIDYNTAQAYQVAQKTGESPIAVEPLTSAQEKMTNLFNLTAKGQELQRQAALAQELQQQTAIRTASDTKGVPQEEVTNQNGQTKRKALRDVTNTSTNDPDIRAAKRARSDNSQIDENSANPSRETKIKAAELRSEIDLPEIDREKLKEQIEAQFKQEQQESRKQFEQELAKRLQYQGVPPTSDATQQPDKKHPDSDSDSNPDSQAQLHQLEAKLSDAQQNGFPQDEIQNLQDRINQLQSKTSTKGKISDAQRLRI